jgi:hypothetical protein
MGRTWNTKVDRSAFDEKMIEAVWEKGKPEPGHPTFRKDSCGASMERSRYGKEKNGDGKSTMTHRYQAVERTI